MVFENFFGPELLHNGTGPVPTSQLEGKTVLIYFSAHWCPPCRGFTPVLAEFYKKLHAKRQDFELVFVSSDRDQKSFDEYYGEMPWLGLPYPLRDLKEKLSKKFNVRGIPTLVVLDKEGNFITAKGRDQVAGDPEGANFPWVPQTLDELLGTKFVSKGNVPSERTLKGKVFGLYFSAHWCPPCRGFTPKLAAAYTALKEQHPDFEIVFVSSDRSEQDFGHYLDDMPWVALPFADRTSAKVLGEHFEVEGIPTLVIIDTDLSIITTNGVSAISQGLAFPFRPLPLNDLTQDTAGDINEHPSLIVFVDPAQKEATRQILQPIAEEYSAAKKNIRFFLASEDPLQIREFGKLRGTPSVSILDIQSQAKYVDGSGVVTTESVRAFLTGFFSETLTKKSIKEE